MGDGLRSKKPVVLNLNDGFYGNRHDANTIKANDTFKSISVDAKAQVFSHSGPKTLKKKQRKYSTGHNYNCEPHRPKKKQKANENIEYNNKYS